MRCAWFLVGPTAVGKTAVAQFLAESCGAAILSADAMLVYRGMDIGTAKPAPSERGCVPYFGIDLVDPDLPFSAGAWMAGVCAQLAAGAWGCRTTPGNDPTAGDLIVAGGTGLYVRALTAGLDAAPANPERRRHWQERLTREGLPALRAELTRLAPEVAAPLADPDNPRRVIRALEQAEAGRAPTDRLAVARPVVVGLRLPRPALHARIAARVARMFAEGFVEEVAALRRRFPAWANPHTLQGVRVGEIETVSSDAATTATAPHAIGYAEVCALLDGALTRAQAIERISSRTRQLAKRQETWFRHQTDAIWLDLAPDEPVATVASRVREAWRKHGPTTTRLP